MAHSSKSFVNMDGSDTFGYRYQMPALLVKVEGGGSKMRKSVLVNIADVCREMGRPTNYLITYLGQAVSANAGFDKDGKAYVTGSQETSKLQQHVFKFIREAVACGKCGNPETTCHLQGKKKHTTLCLTCKACGGRTELDSSSRFVKYMIAHPTDDAARGHAGPANESDVADSAVESTKKTKIACPVCGHKTDKAECKKCGAAIMSSTEPDPMEPDGDVAEEEARVDCFHEDVAKWMEQSADMRSKDPASAAEDLRVHLCSMGHRGSTPLDRLQAVMRIHCSHVCDVLDKTPSSIQPVAVAKQVETSIRDIQPFIEDLVNSVKDTEAAVKSMVSVIRELAADAFECTGNTDTVVVGILLAMRDQFDSLPDSDLILGCQSLPNRGVAIDKFIEFLEEDGDSETDAEDA